MFMNSCRLFLIAILTFVSAAAYAQTASQPNIDFELGNTSIWTYYTGHCCPLVLDTPTSALPNRHTLTSGSDLDPYGNFPIVSPGGGNFSLRLGDDQVFSQAERAQYVVHVPAGLNNYSLIYRYAVVFQDPGHADTAQPRFAVNTYESVTGEPINCAQYLYIASSNLPGFKKSAIENDVLYKEWSTASINLSGWGGHSIIVDFTTGDCALGAHFGYGYIDVSGGLFAISTAVCNRSQAQLQGPYGFAHYLWYDSSLTTLLDTNEIGTFPNPITRKTYALVVQPFPGYGCPDTLYSTIYNSQLELDPQPDKTICRGGMVTIKGAAENGAGPYSYFWKPGGICDGCRGFTKAVLETTDFIVKISDSTGCNVTDTIRISVDSCAITYPTAFTPNNDGLNDIFRAIGNNLDYYKNYSLAVYNRFGQRVFFSRDIYAGWNGIFNNQPADIGTYFYMANYTLNSESYMLKGDVTLVK